LDQTNSEERATPIFLVEAADYDQGCKRVRHFLDKTALLKYDSIEFSPEYSWIGSQPQFWQTLETGIAANRASVKELVSELKESGFHQLEDLERMKQGYESKILHILVHLLDGFIGIDTSFYNLIEDSHQISLSLSDKIKQDPHKYILLQISAKNSLSIRKVPKGRTSLHPLK